MSIKSLIEFQKILYDNNIVLSENILNDLNTIEIEMIFSEIYDIIKKDFDLYTAMFFLGVIYEKKKNIIKQNTIKILLSNIISYVVSKFKKKDSYSNGQSIYKPAIQQSKEKTELHKKIY